MTRAAALRRFFDQWLFRLGGAEPAPIVLVQRRVFVLPTRAGVVFGATLLLMLIGSINYLVSLGYVLSFMLAGLGVAGILHTFRNLVHLSLEPGRCAPVFAGETACFEVLLRNPHARPRAGLRLRLADAPAVTTEVPAQGSALVRLHAPAPRRGWRRPGRVTIETTYPLGLIRAWSYAEPDMRVLVYPAPETAPPPLPAPPQGVDAGRPTGSGSEDFSGLRAFQPSDSPRHVAWKSFAREAPLLTKQFAGGGTASLWIDWHQLPPGLDVEQRLSRLAAYVLQAQRSGQAFGLRLPGLELAPAAGRAQADACLKALALHGQD